MFRWLYLVGNDGMAAKLTHHHHHHEEDRVIGWFRAENGTIVMAAVVEQIGKDKLVVEDVANFHHRYTIHTRYFNQSPLLHGMA